YGSGMLSPRLQRLFEHLGITLVVVQRRPCSGHALDGARLEAALAEPVRGTGGEHEQGLDPLRPCPGLDASQQLVATTAMVVVGVDRHTGQLAAVGIDDGTPRRTGDAHPSALDDAEPLHLAL